VKHKAGHRLGYTLTRRNLPGLAGVLFVATFVPLAVDGFALADDMLARDSPPDAFFTRDEKYEDFGDSETLVRLAAGDAASLGTTGGSLFSPALDWGSAILRAFTLAFQWSFTSATLSLIGPSLGLPLQIIFFSILPMAFPRPDVFTTEVQTGKSVIFFKR
jgi:hypothetical protein